MDERIFTIDDISLINKAIKEHGGLSGVPMEIKKFSDREVKRKAEDLGFHYDSKQKAFVKIEVPTMSQDEIIKRLLELENKVAKIGKHEKSHNSLEIDKKYTTDGITRSFNVSKGALEKFNKAAETKFAQFRKQDLLTIALLEFVENHK